MKQLFNLFILILLSLNLISCAKNEAIAPKPVKITSFQEFQDLEVKTLKGPTSRQGMKTEDGGSSESADAPQEPDCTKKRCQAYRQEFRYVVYVGKQIYCYWDEKKSETQTDFDALAKKLESSITDNTNHTQYYLTLRKWAGAFHDGHVNAMHREDRSPLEVYSAPLRLEVLAPGTDHENIVVADPGKFKNLLAGMPILEIDGKTTKQALDDLEVDTSGSTRRMRRYSASYRLVDRVGIEAGTETLSFTVKTNANESDTLKIRTARTVQLYPRSVPSVDSEETGLEGLQVKILPGKIAYMRIDGFYGEKQSEMFVQALNKISKTNGLILDLRQNGGGSMNGNVILSRLTKAPMVRYKTSIRISDFLLANRPDYFLLSQWKSGSFTDWFDLSVNPTEDEHYGKPVMALTSSMCFSACDTFTAGLKANNLATIIGEPTGGGTGTPLVFELPVSGHSFRYSVVRGRNANDILIEGSGTEPDILVERTSTDILAGKDLPLETAIAEILKRTGTENSASLSELSAIVQNAFGGVQKQRLDIAPTVAEDIRLREYSRYSDFPILAK